MTPGTPAVLGMLAFVWRDRLPLAWWLLPVTAAGFNALGDHSCGIYLYAFPVRGLAVWLMGPQSPAMNMLHALPPTILPGGLSWGLIEKPAMAQRARLARLAPAQTP